MFEFQWIFFFYTEGSLLATYSYLQWSKIDRYIYFIAFASHNTYNISIKSWWNKKCKCRIKATETVIDNLCNTEVAKWPLEGTFTWNFFSAQLSLLFVLLYGTRASASWLVAKLTAPRRAPLRWLSLVSDDLGCSRAERAASIAIGGPALSSRHRPRLFSWSVGSGECHSLGGLNYYGQ